MLKVVVVIRDVAVSLDVAVRLDVVVARDVANVVIVAKTVVNVVRKDVNVLPCFKIATLNGEKNISFTIQH